MPPMQVWVQPLIQWGTLLQTMGKDEATTQVWPNEAHVRAWIEKGTALLTHCRAARTIVEQTPTKIFLPNNQASRSEYVNDFGMTAGEFTAFSSLTEGSRRFLVKQGSNAVICELDLTEFRDDLAILSGKSQTVRLQRAIRRVHGDDPAVWLPVFLEEARKLGGGPW